MPQGLDTPWTTSTGSCEKSERSNPRSMTRSWSMIGRGARTEAYTVGHDVRMTGLADGRVP